MILINHFKIQFVLKILTACQLGKIVSKRTKSAIIEKALKGYKFY